MGRVGCVRGEEVFFLLFFFFQFSRADLIITWCDSLMKRNSIRGRLGRPSVKVDGWSDRRPCTASRQEWKCTIKWHDTDSCSFHLGRATHLCAYHLIGELIPFWAALARPQEFNERGMHFRLPFTFPVASASAGDLILIACFTRDTTTWMNALAHANSFHF